MIKVTPSKSLEVKFLAVWLFLVVARRTFIPSLALSPLSYVGLRSEYYNTPPPPVSEVWYRIGEFVCCQCHLAKYESCNVSGCIWIRAYSFITIGWTDCSTSGSISSKKVETMSENYRQQDCLSTHTASTVITNLVPSSRLSTEQLLYTRKHGPDRRGLYKTSITSNVPTVDYLSTISWPAPVWDMHTDRSTYGRDSGNCTEYILLYSTAVIRRSARSEIFLDDGQSNVHL